MLLLLLYLGIGNPPGTMDMKAFLLQKFSSVERKQVRLPLHSNTVPLCISLYVAAWWPRSCTCLVVEHYCLVRFSFLTFVCATQQIDAALEQGVEAVRTLALNGFSQRVNRFNLSQKYKYHKVWSSGKESCSFDHIGKW